MAGDVWLTYRGAAKRVGRSIRAINRWRAHGMPMGTDDQGRRIVREADLLTAYRERLTNDPVHQNRIRQKTRAEDDGRAGAQGR